MVLSDAFFFFISSGGELHIERQMDGIFSPNLVWWEWVRSPEFEGHVF